MSIPSGLSKGSIKIKAQKGKLGAIVGKMDLGYPLNRMSEHTHETNGHAHASKRMANADEFLASKIDWGGKCRAT